MIKKLRRRIILINMLLIGIVILGIFAAVNINNFANSVRTMEHGLNQLLEKNNRFDLFPPGEFDDSNPEGTDNSENFENAKPFKIQKHGMDGDIPMEITSYIIVTLDSEGNITDKQENNITIDDADLETCVKLATERSGQIGDYSLMYAVHDDMGSKRIAFTGNSSIYSSLRSSLLISFGLFAAALGVIFVISLFLSGLAVKPVQKAWTQQKQFVADASHELKTPLTVILANNNIMMSHTDSTVRDERQWLESTQEEARHMKQLIDEMLFLAKSDAGTDTVQFSEVNLSEITEGCALNFEPVAFEKNVEIVSEIAPDVTLQGNATQLNQLAHILVDNAVKYADNGTAVTLVLQQANDRAVLSVNNLGNVISKDDIEHIFDRFYRAEKSRTTKGYGLGLSIAQKIVQSHNGRLTVESNAEQGTTFTATLGLSH